MKKNEYAPKWFIITAILILIALAFFVVKPYVSAILAGIFLAYVFNIPFKKLNKKIKKPGFSAAIICIAVILFLGIAIYFLAQVTIKEAFDFYLKIQEIDVAKEITNFFQKLFHASSEVTEQISITIRQAILKLTNTFILNVSEVITDIPKLLIQAFITFFVFFYFLKEGDNVMVYLKRVMPFNKKIKERFFKRSANLTWAIIFGQIVTGLIQGAVAGIFLYFFKAPSPVFFTLLSMLCGVLPFIGPWLVLIPLGLFMIAENSTLLGILLIVIGVPVTSIVGEWLRAFFVGKKGFINPAVALVGMLGGLKFMGIIGLVIGPLILEYLLIFVDLLKKNVA